jgi:penicillin amidase
MFDTYPLLSRFVLFILLPAIIATALGLAYVDRSLPKRSGALFLAGLGEPVHVTFDAHGTPTVLSSNDDDAFFAQGYLHASERLWQMELQRRLVQGRLSEIFGEGSVSGDRWMRILGLQHAALEAWAHLDADSQRALEAYANGVNALLNSKKQLPVEFYIFGVAPDAWKPVDSLAWEKMLALLLGGNFGDELMRVDALHLIDLKQFKTFFPYDLPDAKSFPRGPGYTDFIAQKSVDRSANRQRTGACDFRLFDEQSASLVFNNNWPCDVQFSGSNAWVVTGRYTKSGAPMVVGDPHLPIEQPSMWYAIQMHGAALSVSGMSLVGVPGVVIGRNANIAWAATNSISDQQDLFALDIPLDNSSVYRTDRGYAPITMTDEWIKINPGFPVMLNKAIEPVKVTIRRTALGPIISDAFKEAPAVYALRWSSLDADDKSFEAFFRLQYAKDWGDFEAALALLKGPGLTVVYGDVRGNIGSQLAGSLPRRGRGAGTLPQLAYYTDDAWHGYVPFEDMPRLFNPSSGLIVSANDQILSPQNLVVSHEWLSPSRKLRIAQLLEENIDGGNRFDANSMSRIQTDSFDSEAHKITVLLKARGLAAILMSRVPRKLAATAGKDIQYFMNWDGKYSLDSVGATLFHYWLSEFKPIVFHALNPDGLPLEKNRLANSLMDRVQLEEIANMLTAPSEWCRPKPADAIMCENEVIEGFYAAISELILETKTDNNQLWKWGAMQRSEYSHVPFGTVKAFGNWFTRVESTPGSENTINLARSIPDKHGGLKQIFGPSYRQVFDLGNRDTSYYVLPTGESGILASPNYADMALAFRHGKICQYAHISDSAGDSNVAQAQELVLLPVK